MHIFKRVFFALLSAAVIISALTQILLLNDNSKAVISNTHRLESEYSGKKSNYGYILLEFSYPYNNTLIMQNGDIISSVNSKTQRIDIYDNCVIELDGRKCIDDVYVKIKEISDNIYGYYDDELKIINDIKILGRFFVK